MQNSALMERRVRGNLLARCGVGEKLEMISKTYLSLCKEGAEILADNCQDTIFGGFAPNSKTAEALSKSLGSYTVQSGSVSKGGGKDGSSRSLQMMERPLMTPDELKSIPKGEFVVMKTGSHPMRTRLRLFLDWGITFEEPYQTPEHGQRKVYYAGREELEEAIKQRFLLGVDEAEKARFRKQERAEQKRGTPKLEAQVDSSVVTAFGFTKKQDNPPPGPDER